MPKWQNFTQSGHPVGFQPPQILNRPKKVPQTRNLFCAVEEEKRYISTSLEQEGQTETDERLHRVATSGSSRDARLPFASLDPRHRAEGDEPDADTQLGHRVRADTHVATFQLGDQRYKTFCFVTDGRTKKVFNLVPN